MRPDIDAVIEIARRAGSAILKVYEKDFEIERKGDQSPLTEADLASHRVIVEGLKALTPDIPVMSEESAAIPYDERRGWRQYWLVDPLDGTKEFIKRNGEFTINIALIEGGSPTLGVVYVPAGGVLYHGRAGEGAVRIDDDGMKMTIHVTERRRTPMLIAGSRTHAGDSLKRFLERVGDYEIVSMGSSLKLCLVAEGSADVYPRLGPTSEWDTAAAQAVVEAAGGQVTDTELRPLRYNRKESLLNPYFLAFGDSSEDWKAYID